MAYSGSAEEQREKRQAYYLKNRERIRVQQRAYMREYGKTDQRKEYMRQYYGTWYQTRGKARRITREYGLTLEQYTALLTSQGNKCAVCDSPNPAGKGDWNVDHSHSTQKVRGLLCHHCNLLLGQAKDDTEILQRAIDYLKAHNHG